jgi:FkbM family methyltransferase
MSALTELYKRWQLFRHKPRHFRLRPGTIDRRLFREVVVANAYELPPRFAPTDVLLDVGAHVGCFALAALRRGAGTVWCCEPAAANFALLEHNLAPFGPRAPLLRAAVWRSDEAVPLLPFRNPTPRNTGAGGVGDGPGGEKVPALPFDRLVERACARGPGRVRLAKLDCEGAEWPALLTSRALHRVDALCGEYHLGPLSEQFAGTADPARARAVLADCLAAHGLRCRLAPHPQAPHLGLFFAERGPAEGAGALVLWPSPLDSRSQICE